MRTFEIGDRVKFNFPRYLNCDVDLGTIIEIDNSKTDFQFIVAWDTDPFDDSGYNSNDFTLLMPSSYLDFEERIRERMR